MSKIRKKDIGKFPSRGIVNFYEWIMRYVPIAIMLAHWYGTWDFHHQPRLILLDNRNNEACVAFIYFMVYVFPVISMFPASLSRKSRKKHYCL